MPKHFGTKMVILNKCVNTVDIYESVTLFQMITYVHSVKLHFKNKVAVIEETSSACWTTRLDK